MKKTLAMLLLVILSVALFLCGCNVPSQKEESQIIEKIEIREDANYVTVVYEDGYELTYTLKQPIETIVEKDGIRSARAVGVAFTVYSISTDSTNNFAGVWGEGDHSASIDGEGNFVISGGAIAGNASMSDFQVQVGTTVRYFEKDGKKYVDYAADLLAIFRKKTTLIDFVTGFEEEPYDNISASGFEKFENLEAVILPASIKTVGKKAFDNCPKLTAIYFFGTDVEWQEVELVGVEEKTVDEEKYETVTIIENALTKCTVYFYSETEPTDSGFYWHYVDGVPAVW